MSPSPPPPLRPFAFGDELKRTSDGLFIKLSYRYRIE